MIPGPIGLSINSASSFKFLRKSGRDYRKWQGDNGLWPAWGERDTPSGLFLATTGLAGGGAFRRIRELCYEAVL
jgi:hypothetical protein